MAGIFRNIRRSFLDCNGSLVSTRKIDVHLGFLLVWVDFYLVWFWKLFLVFAFGLFFRKTIPTSSCPPPKAAVSLTSLHLSKATAYRPHWQLRVCSPQETWRTRSPTTPSPATASWRWTAPSTCSAVLLMTRTSTVPTWNLKYGEKWGLRWVLRNLSFPVLCSSSGRGRSVGADSPKVQSSEFTGVLDSLSFARRLLQRNYQVHLSGPAATAKWRYGSWRSRLPPDFIAEFKSCFT